jgi:hypothetical protein
MGFLSTLKEKVSLPKESNVPESYDEDMQNLDSLIEDLFKLDEKVLNTERQKEQKQD